MMIDPIALFVLLLGAATPILFAALGELVIEGLARISAGEALFGDDSLVVPRVTTAEHRQAEGRKPKDQRAHHRLRVRTSGRCAAP